MAPEADTKSDNPPEKDSLEQLFASDLTQAVHGGEVASGALHAQLPESDHGSVRDPSSEALSYASQQKLQPCSSDAQLALVPRTKDAAQDSHDNLGQSSGPASIPNSLYELQNAGSAAEINTVPDTSSAANVPLPPKRKRKPQVRPYPHGLATAHPTSDRTRHQSRQERSYWGHIYGLKTCLPHLKDLAPDRVRYHIAGRVRCIDCLRNFNSPYLRDEFATVELQDVEEVSRRISKLKSVSDPEIQTRFILVEDLDPTLIECLGRVFSIDPELFAEHLNRSGFTGADYADATPDQWDTSSIIKPYASLKWYRVVQQNPKVTEWLQRPDSILNRRLVAPGNQIRRIPGCARWLEPELDNNGARTVSRREHQIVAGTNIFRRSWSLSTRPSTKREDLDGSKSWRTTSRRDRHGEAEVEVTGWVDANTNRRWRDQAVPTAWEEKASCFRYDKAAAPIFIILLDPLPQVIDHEFAIGRDRKVEQDGPTRSSDYSTLVDMCYPRVPRGTVFLPHNKYEATPDEIETFRTSTETVKPTLDAVLEWAHWVPSLEFNGVALSPIQALLQIVQADTNTFFQSLELALDEISQDSLDDYLITRRLSDWRRLLSDFEIEVPLIKSGLRNFLDFTFPATANAPSTIGQDTQQEDLLVKRLPKAICTPLLQIQVAVSRLQTRIDSAYTALRSDMSFAESRRSIAEARAVTRLTELAFVFIPVSFTCSLFSMDILELEGGVPLWTFIITAFSFFAATYAIRTIITSDFVARSSRDALEQFWARRDVRRGENAPTFTLVMLTIREIWKTVGYKYASYATFALVMASGLVVPTTFLWTSARLDRGFNIALTLFFLFSGLGLAWLVASLALGDFTLGLASRKEQFPDASLESSDEDD